MDDRETRAPANATPPEPSPDSQRSAGSPTPIGRTIETLLAKINAMPDAPTAPATAEDAMAAEAHRRRSAWQSLCQQIGRRYASCTLESYRVDCDEQRIVVDVLRTYCRSIANNLKQGRGALLYGPPGTGKDHLAAAVMRAAILHAGAKVAWTDGAEFYGRVRDNIDGGKSEAALLAGFTSPDLLVVSDPLPPAGRVDSTFQLSMLFRVIDRRYRDQRATIMTLNVADRAEAENRLTPNIIDRLAHGSYVLHCCWKSFRKL